MSVTMLKDLVAQIKPGDYVEVAYLYSDGSILNTRKIVQGNGETLLIDVNVLGQLYVIREADGSVPKGILRVTLLPFKPPVAVKAGPIPRDPRSLAVHAHDPAIYALPEDGAH